MRCLRPGDFPCGRCPACLANRQRGFMFRLDFEKDQASFYFWLTLQYDEDHVPRLPSGELCFDKSHCRAFFEHIRIKYREQQITFKHFLVSEYGPNGTHRPHYHCLLLVYCPDDMSINAKYVIRQEMREYLIHQAWKYGYVCEKSYHGRVISYLTKYCCKPELVGEYHTMAPFTLISPGIGLGILNQLGDARLSQMRKSLDFMIIGPNGKKQMLPRYLIEKIYPYSRNDRMKAIDDKDLERYKELHENAMRMRLRNKMLLATQFKEVMTTFKGDYVAYVKKRQADYSLAMSDFKSKLKNRKSI